MRGAANVLVRIDDQNLQAAQLRPLLILHRLRMRLAGGHFLPDLLNHLLDVAGVAEDALQPLDDVRARGRCSAPSSSRRR